MNKDTDKDARDNRAGQLDPKNDKFWQSRGLPGKPPSEDAGGAQPNQSAGQGSTGAGTTGGQNNPKK